MRKWIPLYAAVILLLAGSRAAQAGTSLVPRETRSALQSQVQVWTDALSEQPSFQSWKEAEADIVPIGPGTHGWLVTLHIGRKPVGYMIVNATEEGGFMLGEYGTGSHPVFDPNTLYQSLVRQGLFPSYADALKKPLQLERLYVQPLLAVWKYTPEDGKPVFLDAWTGEALPITADDWLRQTAGLPADQNTVSPPSADNITSLAAARLNAPFDAYETMPWLTRSPLSQAQLASLPGLLDGKAKIRFTTELFGSTVRFVWPAVGYHRWNEGTEYVAFDQRDQPGTRYIPMSFLQAGGSFFR